MSSEMSHPGIMRYESNMRHGMVHHWRHDRKDVCLSTMMSLCNRETAQTHSNNMTE